MIALDAFNKHIAIDVPGCPSPVMQHAVLWAAIRFCRESLALFQDAMPIKVVAAQDRYEIEPKDEQTKVEMILSAKLDGRDLNAPHRNNRRTTGSVYGYELSADNEVRLLGVPTGAGTLELEIAIAPAEDATELPDDLLRYQLAIAAGAKERLFLMPRTTWTNPQLATLNAGNFRIGVNAALVDGNRRRSRGPIRMTSRPFA